MDVETAADLAALRRDLERASERVSFLERNAESGSLATTTRAGLIKAATDAVAVAGTATDSAIVPANLSSIFTAFATVAEVDFRVSTSTTTLTTSWADLPGGLSITFSLSEARTVLILGIFNFNNAASGATRTANGDIYLDGSSVFTDKNYDQSIGNSRSSTQVLAHSESLSSGSHTVKLMGKTSTSSAVHTRSSALVVITF